MPTETSAAEPPRALYLRRLGELFERRAQLHGRERTIGYTQLALAAVAVMWILFRLRHFQAVDLLILLPVAAFIVLAFIHSHLQRSSALCTRAVGFYEQGIARLDDAWAGKGAGGERFLSPSDPCARDLDLFGHASLFELLSSARTGAGEETLARWLLVPVPPDEVRARQQAAMELSTRVSFRERLFTIGDEVRRVADPAELIAWGEAGDSFPSGGLRLILPILALTWIASILAWQVWGAPELLVLISTLINLGISYRFHTRLGPAAHAAEHADHDLLLLSELLTAFETEPFTSSRLLELQRRLQRQENLSPSLAIAKLNRVVEFLESAHNLFVRVFDFFLFYRLQLVLAAESWRRRFGPSLRVWLDAVGELEALAALGAYTYEHPGDVFPEFVDGAPCFHAEGLAHPLIPRDRAIRNDLRLDGDLQLMIVSGPNMAGKSTFLRGIGVNAVLAQCGAPVRAVSLRLSPLTVTASICVLDSLEGGISRFYAEINRLKQIMDLTNGPNPVLFLMDELLSGTNSHDRLIGTRSIVTRLVEKGAIGLVSTHDLALTAIPNDLGSRATNCHFEDHLNDGRLAFDYKLYPGIVQTSNALPLMRSIGLEV